jgi:hypothetical protein
VSCIQHDVTATIGGVAEADAFTSWLAGGDLGRSIGYKWADTCGPDDDGATPCNSYPRCAPF